MLVKRLDAMLINMTYFEKLRDLDEEGSMGLARAVIGIFLDT